MQAIIDTPAGPGRERAERASRRLSDFIAKRRILTDLLDAVDAAPSSGDREREALSVRDMIALALYIDHDTIVDHDALSDAFDGHSCPHLYDAGLLFVQQIPSGEYVDSITDAGLRAFADAYARLDSPPSPSPTGGEAAGAPQAIDAEAVIDLLAFVVASHGRGDDHPDDYEEQARCRCGWEGQWRKDGQASADARRHVVEQHLPPPPRTDGRRGSGRCDPRATPARCRGCSSQSMRRASTGSAAASWCAFARCCRRRTRRRPASTAATSARR